MNQVALKVNELVLEKCSLLNGLMLHLAMPLCQGF